MNLIIFGSSITWGAWDEEGGWAQRIKSFEDNKAALNNYDNYTEVYTLGISGNNTIDILERFDAEVKARLEEGQKSFILVEVGINDSQYSLKEDKHRVPPEEYKNNLLKLIEKSKKLGAEIMFLGLTPVDERVNIIPWKQTHSYRPEFVKKYDEILRGVCEENNIPFIEIMSKFMEKDYKSLLTDGLHPTTAGHEIMFQEAKEYLTEKGIL